MVADSAVVCDASVLVAIAFGEPASDGAQALIRGERLYAPTLLRYELAHVAVRRARLSETDEQVWRALSAALCVPARLLEPSWHEVFHLARVQRLSAYDASYLQIALALKLPLATLDAALAGAAERLGVTLRH